MWNWRWEQAQPCQPAQISLSQRAFQASWYSELDPADNLEVHLLSQQSSCNHLLPEGQQPHLQTSIQNGRIGCLPRAPVRVPVTMAKHDVSESRCSLFWVQSELIKLAAQTARLMKTMLQSCVAVLPVSKFHGFMMLVQLHCLNRKGGK